MLIFVLNSSFVNDYFNCDNGDEWQIGNDAQQGCILSKILFIIYFNDVIQRTLELKAGYKLNSEKYNIIAFADDIVQLAPSKTGLQLVIDNLSEFLAKIN